MMDVKVQHEDPSIQTSPLLTVPVTVIPETSSAQATTIPPPILLFMPLQQQLTPIPTPTTTEATTTTIAVPSSETLSAIHLRVSDMEKEVKELKNVDHSLALCATIKSEVSAAVKEYIGISLDDALYKVLQKQNADLSKEHSILADVVEKLKQQDKPQKSAKDIRKVKMEQARKQQETRYTITIFDSAELQEFDQKRTLFETMTKTKSFNKNTKHNALYHALMKSILKDKDAMGKGVADMSKKRKPDDADRDEGPPTGPDQGLKRKETGKDADPKDWFKKPKRPPTPDPEWNEGKTVNNKPTQKWLSDLAKAETSSKTFDDLMSTPIDFSAFVMNRLQISDLTQDMLIGPAYKILKGIPKGDRYPFNLSKPLPLVKSGNRQIVLVDYFFNNDLAYLQGESTGRTYTTSLTKTKAAKYDLPGIEDMVPNLWSPIKVAYDKHGLLGTSHWGPKRQRFYRYDSKRVSKHDVYSTKRILAVTNVKVNVWYSYGHLEEIKV
ncbi:hypothetical protein Tco_0783316 [Tanacetum coccineum]